MTFTETQQSNIKEWYTKRTFNTYEIAKKLDCSQPTILKEIKRLGISIPQGKSSRIFDDNEARSIVREYQQGRSTVDIGREQACTAATIRNLLLRNGVKLRDKSRKGRTNVKTT